MHTSIGVSETVPWETADLFGPIRIYETADTFANQNSGLTLSNGASVSLHGLSANEADLVLGSDPTSASGLSFVAGAVSSVSGLPQGRLTLVSQTVSADMDSVFFMSDLSLALQGQFNSVDIPPASSGPISFVARTTDNHYARLEILQQPNGKLYETHTDGFSYIDVRGSYQRDVAAPYAGRPSPRTSAKKRTASLSRVDDIHWSRVGIRGN